MHKDFISYANLCDTASVACFGDKILYHLTCDMRTLDENATVAERIRFFRTKRNMNGDTLAELIGLSRFAIMDYENGISDPILAKYLSPLNSDVSTSLLIIFSRMYFS